MVCRGPFAVPGAPLLWRCRLDTQRTPTASSPCWRLWVKQLYITPVDVQTQRVVFSQQGPRNKSRTNNKCYISSTTAFPRDFANRVAATTSDPSPSYTAARLTRPVRSGFSGLISRRRRTQEDAHGILASPSTTDDAHRLPAFPIQHDSSPSERRKTLRPR